MKKNFKLYLVCWAALLVLFNVIVFVIPMKDARTASFWAGYALISVSFVGQLICTYIALKGDDVKKIFNKISLVQTSYIGLLSSFSAGSFCMRVSWLPYWVGVIFCAAVLVTNIIAVMQAAVAVNEVERVEEKIKTQTAFIKSLTVDADSLIARAKSDSVKAECKKIYEAIRYSDPMSNPALESIENDIARQFKLFTDAVKSDSVQEVELTANEICILVNERNKKCRLLK